MRVFVIGAGYVGRVLCDLLDNLGHEVVAVTRCGGAGSMAADVADRGALRALREEVGAPDAVVHCASAGRGSDREARYRAVYLRGCQNVVEVLAPGRLVFASSTSVYGQTDGSVVDEGSPAAPSIETGSVLLEAEVAALAAGGTVARLAGIYGPGRSYLLKRYLSGEAAIDAGVAGAGGRWLNQIHRDDAASALAFLVAESPTSGIYNVADDTPLSQRACYEEFGRRFGGELPPVRRADHGKARGWSHKRVANGKLRAAGWAPRFASYFDALDGDPSLTISSG